MLGTPLSLKSFSILLMSSQSGRYPARVERLLDERKVSNLETLTVKAWAIVINPIFRGQGGVDS